MVRRFVADGAEAGIEDLKTSYVMVRLCSSVFFESNSVI